MQSYRWMHDIDKQSVILARADGTDMRYVRRYGLDVHGGLSDTEEEVEVVAETSDKRSTGHLAAVHVVSKEEAVSGAYSIDDVVLPLPGSCISYPQHASAQVLDNFVQY